VCLRAILGRVGLGVRLFLPSLPRALEAAIREVVGKRGVSVLVLPGDVALQPAVAAPTGKSGGLLPLSPVVTSTVSRHYSTAIAADNSVWLGMPRCT
jgi:hypothetical protein